MKALMFPTRLRGEGVTVSEFDRYQDSEGLSEASAKVRIAWKAFGPVWRAQRDMELSECEKPPGILEAEKLPATLLRCGRAFGHVNDGRRPELDRRERKAWYRYKTRIVRADPDVWSMIWLHALGRPVAEIASGYGVEARYVVAVLAMAVRWWQDEWKVGPIVAKTQKVGVG